MTTQLEQAARRVLELIEPIAHNSTDDPRGKAYEAITALRAALEQPVQDDPFELGKLGADMDHAVPASPEIQSSVEATINQPAQDERPPFRFRRFVYGQERAQDVVIERQDTLEKAIKRAAQICPKAEMTVLVYESRPQSREPKQPAQQAGPTQSPYHMLNHKADQRPFKQPAQDEPVAWITEESALRLLAGGNIRGAVPVHASKSCTAKIPLYTGPQAREPLTDEQREEIAKGWRGRNWTVGDIIDAIEAAHGIKEKKNGHATN